ncbi:uncharacterized protein Z518_04860 [Rhinocladiella mackenziei CBS 650.93]|uniref:Rhinocladiella mackenziei CBS 650.93 unplaced genomic scaffold supercont1.3, whole genome shotgun sequence n=1 Tax=Rhinocladiella mackenziei CBS 650.93 TaxID=1442369 RepID=A0A0D2IMA3_9EURO|nr:uncharacterized protein Z518_04860 [Rhinocladiella mackenziei CBS 650.93]KIX06884.1 hypothetical protein Z518_04860 [Rhinocladiella mackenziei CBS 650.93]
MSPDPKSNTSFDAASISASSLMSEKERAQAEGSQRKPKESLVKRVVKAIKNIEPPEPRIPEGRRETLPAWAR